MTLSRSVAGGLLLILFLAGQVNAQSGLSPGYEWKQCDEDVLGLRVNPARVENAVGPDMVLKLENGKAMVAILVQDCSLYWIDGKNLGPNKMIHVLVRIEGAEDVRPVVGAPHTQPTLSWFGAFTGSTNPRDREARKASGTAPEVIESVSLGAPGYPRGGSVTVGPGERFSWRIESAEPSAGLIGVNHDVYVRDSSGGLILKRVQAIARPVAVPSPGVLDIDSDAELAELIGAGRHPTRVYTFFPIWARATLGETTAGSGKTCSGGCRQD